MVRTMQHLLYEYFPCSSHDLHVPTIYLGAPPPDIRSGTCPGGVKGGVNHSKIGHNEGMAFIRPALGWWINVNKNTGRAQFTPCESMYACQAHTIDPNGTTPLWDPAIRAECAPHHSGFKCSSCGDDGQHVKVNGRCVTCPHTSFSVLLLQFLAWVGTALLLLDKSTNVYYNHHEIRQVWDQVGAGALPTPAFTCTYTHFCNENPSSEL